MANQDFLYKMNHYMNEVGLVGDSQSLTQTETIDPRNVEEIEISSGGTDVDIRRNHEPMVEICLKTFEDGPVLDVKNPENVLQIHAQQSKHIIPLHIPPTELSIKLPDRLWKRMTVNANSGDISADSVQAIRFILKASSGDLDIKHIHADKVDFITSSGDMDVSGVKAQSLSFTASSGDIELIKVQGSIRGKANSGDITVRSHEGESLDLTAHSGDIDVGKTSVRKSSLRTSSGEIDTSDLAAIETAFYTHSGDVTCSRLSGSVRGSTHSGDAQLQFMEAGKTIDFETRSGDMTLRQPDYSWNAAVEFETSGGIDIGPSLKNEWRQAKGKLKGEIGSGVGRIDLRSKSGDIGWF